MREIKFRVWDEKYGMMPIQKISLKTMKSMPYGWNIAYDFGTVMQYTGFRDKNGKEIYEGDIVSMFHDTQFSQVKWNSEYGCWEIKVQLSIHNEGWDLLGNHLEQCEVIGNIYENPELLEGN